MKKVPPFRFRPKEKSRKLKKLFLNTEKLIGKTKREHVIVKNGKVYLKLGTGVYSVRPLESIEAELTENASKSDRKRAVYSFTPTPPEGVKRVHQFNLIKEGSYVSPHSHKGVIEKWKVAKGKFKVIIADEHGRVLRTKIITPSSKVMVSMPGEYHTLVPLKSGSILHEEVVAKYDPASKLLPAWAPKEGTPDAEKMLKRMQNAARYGNLAIEAYDQHSEVLNRIKTSGEPVRFRKKDRRIYEPKREEELLDE
jgi:cupin fold WbuC family metalloprotein